jgi:hypothetical protein
MRGYHNLATVTGEQEGGREASRRYFKKSAELGRKRGVASEEHYSLAGAVGYARAAGDIIEAEDYLARMDELARRIPDPNPIKFVNNSHRAALWFMRGKWEEGVDLMRECYQDALLGGDMSSLMEISGDLVSALLELNLYGQFSDWPEIDRLISKRIEIADSGVGDKMWPYLQLTILKSRQMRVNEAREALNHANQGGGKKESIWRENYIGHAEAETLTAEGRYPEAISVLDDVATNYARMGASWSWARTLHDWAEVHMKSGSPADFERARALLREAQTLYTDMGAERHAQWLETRLSVLRTKTFNLALASQRDAQELARAAEIQVSFLPEKSPAIDGWDLAVTLKPARQTSGDFYDFIPLAKGRWGVVVADVADKGTAAALFTTTTRSLLRTFAQEYPMWPEVVLDETNKRLLADTRSGIFVTIFYGVLDPSTGLLTYANAGHNPPHLVDNCNVDVTLNRTGTPLGIFEEAAWEQAQVQIPKGNSLIIYTDGVIDSQNPAEELFGENCFHQSLYKHRNKPASQFRDGILEDIQEFVDDAPQFDDITLMVLTRMLNNLDAFLE